MTHTSFRMTGIGTGVTCWHVKGPGIDEHIDASWVGYPTLDLMLRLGISMLTFRRDCYCWHLDTPDREWHDFVLSFPGEPECYRATFSRPDGDTVPFLLARSDDDIGGLTYAPYAEIGKGTVQIDQFVENLLTDSTCVLQQNGFVGYQELWQHNEFPISEFLRLIDVKRGGTPFPRSLVSELDDLTTVPVANNALAECTNNLIIATSWGNSVKGIRERVAVKC